MDLEKNVPQTQYVGTFRLPVGDLRTFGIFLMVLHSNQAFNVQEVPQ